MITYRQATTADIPSLTELMNAQYARIHTPEYFQWQFFDSYYPTACVTAWDSAQLAGMFGIQKRRLTDGTVIGHLIDLLIAPHYRGQGIFAHACERAIEYFGDLEALSVLPNLNGKNACVKSLGMRSIAKIDDLVLKGACSYDMTHLPAVTSPHSTRLGFTADASFRAWRYDCSPLYRYTPVGSSITKTFKDQKNGDEFGDIVDWIETPSPQKIRTACEYLFSTGHKSISTWALPHTDTYAYLRNAGFSHFPRERYFCVRVLQNSKAYLYDVSCWQLVSADAEIY
jgi:GNAT superfamily N-acetyltransferase